VWYNILALPAVRFRNGLEPTVENSGLRSSSAKARPLMVNVKVKTQPHLPPQVQKDGDTVWQACINY
jgi:hypothetical protein